MSLDTQQTAREPLSGDDARLMQEVETRLVEERATAEQVIDQMRSQRARDSTLTAEQARAERIAEFSSRLKAARQSPGEATVEKSQAYQEAAERKRRQRTDKDDGPKQGDDHGPRHSR